VKDGLIYERCWIPDRYSNFAQVAEMKLIEREPTPEMLRAMGAEVRGGSWSMTAIFNAAYDAALDIQQEPTAVVDANILKDLVDNLF